MEDWFFFFQFHYLLTSLLSLNLILQEPLHHLYILHADPRLHFYVRLLSR